MLNIKKWGSIPLAVVCVLLLALWLLSGEVRVSESEREEVWDTRDAELTKVQVETLDATLFQPEVVIQGELTPWQRVTVRARVEGTVESVAVAQGDVVEKDDLLLQLSEESRPQELDRAEAELERAEADLQAASRLRGEDLASQSEYLNRKADVSAASAAVREAELALERTRPRAPFPGTVNRREIEPGDQVQPGEPLIELVQVDRLKVTGRVPQQKATELREGQSVLVDLLDGSRLQGELIFIASAADPETRSFRVEAEIDNPERRRVAGSSATLRIGLEPRLATYISPAHLSLNNDGRLGVRHLDPEDRVLFSTVRLLSTGTAGAWVDGLPLQTRLITRGAGFVNEGDTVQAVPPANTE